MQLNMEALMTFAVGNIQRLHKNNLHVPAQSWKNMRESPDILHRKKYAKYHRITVQQCIEATESQVSYDRSQRTASQSAHFRVVIHDSTLLYQAC